MTPYEYGNIGEYCCIKIVQKKKKHCWGMTVVRENLSLNLFLTNP